MSGIGSREVAYAGLGQRSLAALIDNLIWLILLSQIAGAIPEHTYEDEPLVVGLIFIALLSAWFNYFWLAEWKWGRTVGKAVVRIHVENEDGGRPRFGPATVRNVLRVVDVLGIGPILVARSERRQRLGDRAARTIVVRDHPEPVPATANPRPVPEAGPPPAPLGPSSSSTGSPTPPAGGAGDREGRSPWSRRGIGIPAGGWTPATVTWAVVAVIGLLVVETAIVAAVDPDLDSRGSTLAVQAMLAVTLIGVSIGFAAARGSTSTTLRRLGLRGFTGSALGLAALAYLAYIVFAVIYGLVVQPEQEDITRDLGLDEGGPSAVAAGVLIVAAAPLSEEIFFRGFMFGGLRARLPLWPAALISGAVFGLLHFTGPDSIGVVPQLAFLGVVLAWLYERTGSLWPPIILHVANNSLALVVLTSS